MEVFVSAFVMQKYQVSLLPNACPKFNTINRQKTSYIFVKSFDG